MSDLPKPIKRRLRQLAGKAHEAELRAELARLGEQFDAWRRGEIDSFDLSDRIHEFHNGAAREIWKTYVQGDSYSSVAYAISAGILRRDEIPPEVLDVLKNAIGFYDEMDRLEGSAELAEDAQSAGDGSPRGTPSEALRPFLGIWSADEAEEFERAITESGERVDIDQNRSG